MVVSPFARRFSPGGRTRLGNIGPMRNTGEMKSATIYDVAKLAGVSHQTVTRYLQGFAGMRPATRERVKSALEELDYRPNSAARMLRASRVNRIGALAHRLQEQGPARLLAGVAAQARRRGFTLDIATVDSDPTNIDDALSVVLEHRLAGLVLAGVSQTVIDAVASRNLGMPWIADAGTTVEGGAATVNDLVGRLAAEHLVSLGHRRIGYVAGPDLWQASGERRHGFVATLEASGLEPAWERVGDWSAGSGARAWASLTAEERRATAVVAANDSMALGVLSAATREGVRVPDDLSVVGTDDISEARFLTPPLTTVAMDFEAEGAYLLDQLLVKAHALPDDGGTSLELPSLVIRNSTTPPPMG